MTLCNAIENFDQTESPPRRTWNSIGSALRNAQHGHLRQTEQGKSPLGLGTVLLACFESSECTDIFDPVPGLTPTLVGQRDFLRLDGTTRIATRSERPAALARLAEIPDSGFRAALHLER